MRFAAENVSSTLRNTTPPTITTHRGLRQILRTTTRNKMVFNANVPVTATP